MSAKTLSELRTSVRTLYGDPSGLTATDAEVDLFLKDGINRVLERCPWILSVLVSDQSVTTDAVGGVALPSTINLAQIYSVEVKATTDTTYKQLGPAHAGLLAETEVTASVPSEIAGYYLDGHRINFFPLYRSGTLHLRISYADNSIGSSFPSSAGSSLPTSIPVPAEEAAVVWAISRLHARDNNFEGATFMVNDFEGRIIDLTANHNRPQRGSVLTPYQSDHYLLDAGQDAW